MKLFDSIKKHVRATSDAKTEIQKGTYAEICNILSDKEKSFDFVLDLAMSSNFFTLSRNVEKSLKEIVDPENIKKKAARASDYSDRLLTKEVEAVIKNISVVYAYRDDILDIYNVQKGGEYLQDTVTDYLEHNDCSNVNKIFTNPFYTCEKDCSAVKNLNNKRIVQATGNIEALSASDLAPDSSLYNNPKRSRNPKTFFEKDLID